MWFTFTGTKINRTIELLLDILNVDAELDERSSCFEMSMKADAFLSLVTRLKALLDENDTRLQSALRENKTLIGFTKWGHLLAERFQSEVLSESLFHPKGVKHFLTNFTVKPVNEADRIAIAGRSVR